MASTPSKQGKKAIACFIIPQSKSHANYKPIAEPLNMICDDRS